MMPATPQLALLLSTTCMCIACILLLLALSTALAPPRDERPNDPVAVVINLSRNTSRMKAFTHAFAATDMGGLDLYRLDAIDGSSLDWSRFLDAGALERLMSVQRAGRRQTHPDLTPGAVGCYLSHIQAWQFVASAGAPYGLVFEDDADLPPHIMRQFRGAIDTLRDDDWDIVLLGYEGSGAPVVGSGRLLKMERFLRLHAYAISARAAQRLSGTMLPMNQQVDWELSARIRSEGLRVYGVDPQIVGVQWQGTDIQTPLK